MQKINMTDKQTIKNIISLYVLLTEPLLEPIKTTIINNNTIKNMTKPSQIDINYIKDVIYNKTLLRDDKIINETIKNIQSRIYETIENHKNKNILLEDINYDFIIIAIHKNGIDNDIELINNIALPKNDKNHHKYEKIFSIQVDYNNYNDYNKLYIRTELIELNKNNLDMMNYLIK